MPAPVQESLVALAQQLRITQVPIADGAFKISLGTATGEPPTLTVADTTPVRTIAPGDIDLDLVMKQVRFTNALPTSSATVGGMPIQTFVIQLLEGPTATAGVPGLLAKLTGTVPVVIDSVNQQLAVQVQARWTVRDERGVVEPWVSWSLSETSGTTTTTLAQGTGGQAETPVGKGLADFNLSWFVERATAQGLLLGTFTQLRSALPDGAALPVETTNRTITAEVKLTAASVTTDWIALPPLVLPLPGIPIPTLAAFFDDVQFNSSSGDNGTLVLVPDASPIAVDANEILFSFLRALRDTLKHLVEEGTGTGGVNPFNPLNPLADILKNLVDGLANRPSEVHVRKASTVPHLDGNFPIHGRTGAEDRISSLIFLGPEAAQLRCYDHRNFDPTGGQLDVTLGLPMAAAIFTLKTSSPTSIPPGAASVVVPQSSFNDCLSSVQIITP